MGIGDWGLGIGDWGLGIGPNPQSPIPNPQSPIPNSILFFSFSSFEKYLLKSSVVTHNFLLLINSCLLLSSSVHISRRASYTWFLSISIKIFIILFKFCQKITFYSSF